MPRDLWLRLLSFRWREVRRQRQCSGTGIGGGWTLLSENCRLAGAGSASGWRATSWGSSTSRAAARYPPANLQRFRGGLVYEAHRLCVRQVATTLDATHPQSVSTPLHPIPHTLHPKSSSQQPEPTHQVAKKLAMRGWTTLYDTVRDTHSFSLTHSHTLSLPPSHTLSLPHSLTHTHTHSLTHTLTRSSRS